MRTCKGCSKTSDTEHFRGGGYCAKCWRTAPESLGICSRCGKTKHLSEGRQLCGDKRAGCYAEVYRQERISAAEAAVDVKSLPPTDRYLKKLYDNVQACIPRRWVWIRRDVTSGKILTTPALFALCTHNEIPLWWQSSKTPALRVHRILKPYDDSDAALSRAKRTVNALLSHRSSSQKRKPIEFLERDLVQTPSIKYATDNGALCATMNYDGWSDNQFWLKERPTATPLWVEFKSPRGRHSGIQASRILEIRQTLHHAAHIVNSSEDFKTKFDNWKRNSLLV